MSSAFARSSASGPHGYQSTGLCACCRRYGLVSVARRFARGSSWPQCLAHEPQDIRPALQDAAFDADGLFRETAMVEDIRVLVVDGSPGVAHGLHCGLPGDGVACRSGGGRGRRGRGAEGSRSTWCWWTSTVPTSDGIEIVRPVRATADGPRHRRDGPAGADLAAGALAAGACGVAHRNRTQRASSRSSVGPWPASSSCRRSTSRPGGPPARRPGPRPSARLDS